MLQRHFSLRCKGCHLLAGAAAVPIPAGLPSLRGIANRAGQTGQRIMDTLIQPSHPMPDMQLSTEEILNLIAYLETLRTDPAIPPLITPRLPADKPTFPTPS